MIGMQLEVIARGLREWARGSLPMGAGVELLLRAFDGRFAHPSRPWIVAEPDGHVWVDADAHHVPQARPIRSAACRRPRHPARDDHEQPELRRGEPSRTHGHRPSLGHRPRPGRLRRRPRAPDLCQHHAFSSRQPCRDAGLRRPCHCSTKRSRLTVCVEPSRTTSVIGRRINRTTAQSRGHHVVARLTEVPSGPLGQVLRGCANRLPRQGAANAGPE